MEEATRSGGGWRGRGRRGRGWGAGADTGWGAEGALFVCLLVCLFVCLFVCLLFLFLSSMGLFVWVGCIRLARPAFKLVCLSGGAGRSRCPVWGGAGGAPWK